LIIILFLFFALIALLFKISKVRKLSPPENLTDIGFNLKLLEIKKDYL